MMHPSPFFPSGYERVSQTLLPVTVPCRAFDKTLASAFEKRDDLRNIISLALRRLCVQTSLAMNAHGHQVRSPDVPAPLPWVASLVDPI